MTVTKVTAQSDMRNADSYPFIWFGCYAADFESWVHGICWPDRRGKTAEELEHIRKTYDDRPNMRERPEVE